MSTKLKKVTHNDEKLIQQIEHQMNNCRHGGPKNHEQSTPWFHACSIFIQVYCESMPKMNPKSTPTQITSMLVQAIQTINNPQFHILLKHNGSKKYFGALAVDAWLESDTIYVQRFLTVYNLVDALQQQGSIILRRQLEENSAHGRVLLKRLSLVYSGEHAILKTFLNQITEGVKYCKCVNVVDEIRALKEIAKNPKKSKAKDASTGKNMSHCPDERLPPILQSSSKYWSVKKSAGTLLQKGKIKDSMKLYNKALLMMKQSIDEKDLLDRREWASKLSEEKSRIFSNLSLISMKQQDYQKALSYANDAAAESPNWSKSHCRRAIALEALNRFDAALVAIYRAISIATTDECRIGDVNTKTLNEYEGIQQRIKSALGPTPKEIQNPLVKPIKLPLDICSLQYTLFTEEGPLEKTYEYLTPRDVSCLHQTCRTYSIKYIESERGIRISMTGPLRSLSCRPKIRKRIDNQLEIFCNDINSDRYDAFQKFVLSLRKAVPESVWTAYLHMEMNELSYRAVLPCIDPERTFSILLNQDFRLNEEPYCRMCCMYKYLLLDCDQIEDSTKTNLIEHIDDQLSHNEDDEFLFEITRYGLDDTIMSLLCKELDNSGGDGELMHMCMVLLNNMISKGVRRWQDLTHDHLITKFNSSAHQVYSFSIPTDWPGDNSEEELLPNEEWIDKYFTREDPEVFTCWKYAIFEFLKWVEQLGSNDVQFLLIIKMALIHMNRGRIDMNCFSFPVFFVRKALENNGAVAFSKKFRSQKDFSKLIGEYYDMVALYDKVYPEALEWRDRQLAQAQSTF